MQVGAEQRLVGVDVADPGDPRLVEQERLQRRAPAGGELEQRLRRQLAAERLDPEPRGEVAVELVAGEDDGVAEAARVGEPELRAVVEHHPRAQMASVRGRLVQARPAEAVGRPSGRRPVGAGRADQQVAGHPQVHDQRRAVVEPDDQVLAAPADRLDPRGRSSASSTAAGSSGRVQRSSSTSASSIVRPTTSGSSWRRTVSTSGSSGIGSMIAAITHVHARSSTRDRSTSRRSRASTRPRSSARPRPSTSSRRRPRGLGARRSRASIPPRGHFLIVALGRRRRPCSATRRAGRFRDRAAYDTHLRDLDLLAEPARGQRNRQGALRAADRAAGGEPARGSRSAG